MNTRNKRTRHLVATLSMLAGTLGVFGMLYIMNDEGEGPAKAAKKVAAEFQVQKPKKKKTKPKTKPKKKPQKQAKVARRAPAPNVSTALGGLSFDLPQFENHDLLGGESLLGAKGSGEGLIHDSASVDVKPKPSHQPAPTYPQDARARGIEGYVLLSIRVSESGDVERVRVIKSEPAGIFEDVAVHAAEQWTFEPAQYKGKTVALNMKQKIPFKLTRG